MKYLIESDMCEGHSSNAFQAVEDTIAAIKLIRRVRTEYQVPWTFELGCLLVRNLGGFPQNLLELTEYFQCQDSIIKMGKVYFELLRDGDIPFDPLDRALYTEDDVKNSNLGIKLPVLGDFYVGVGTTKGLHSHFRQKGEVWVQDKIENYQRRFDKDGQDNVFFNYLKDYEETYLKVW